MNTSILKIVMGFVCPKMVKDSAKLLLANLVKKII